MKILWFSLSLLLNAWLAPTLFADETAKKSPTEIQVEEKLDIPYRTGEGADPERHKLDLYYPKDTKNYPTLFFIHGGGWTSGNKKWFRALALVFAKKGIAVAATNYRLSSGDKPAKHPDHIQDVAKSFAWVHSHIKEYGGNPDQIFVSGHSAGGHLAALLACDESYLQAEKLSSSAIKGVIPISGVFVIYPKVAIFEKPFGSDEDRKKASPIEHVRKNLPPFLLIYADKDLPKLGEMAEQMNEKLQADKVESKCLKIESRDHITIVVKAALNTEDPTTKAMLEFIQKKSK